MKNIAKLVVVLAAFAFAAGCCTKASEVVLVPEAKIVAPHHHHKHCKCKHGKKCKCKHAVEKVAASYEHDVAK